MKHHKLNNLIEDLQNVKMTSDEKADVLARSWSAIENIESAHQLSMGTGRIVEVGKHSTSVASTFQTAWYSYFMEKKFIPALSFAILLLATGGTSLAAENSLPGDLLYPVKVGLNEHVRGFTAVTPEAKARFALEVTDRRLKEVALLSSKGLLNEETSAIIQEQLLKQAGQIKNQVASLVATKNVQAAQEISLNFESSLRTHELILEKISSIQIAAAVDADLKASTTLQKNPAIATLSALSSASTSVSVSASDSEASSTSSDAVLLASVNTSANARMANPHIALFINTLKYQIATTTAARESLELAEANDTNLNKDRVNARLLELRLKSFEIKRIASTTPIASTLRASSSLQYIYLSDMLVDSAMAKTASSSLSGALQDIQKASQYLIDAETLILAQFDDADPSLRDLMEAALSLPSPLSPATTTVSTIDTTNASSTASSSALSTASTTDSTK